MKKSRSPEVQRILRERGNPYWSLQYEDQEAMDDAAEHQARREYLRTLENPHAYTAVFGEDQPREVVQEVRPKHKTREVRGISKADFDRGCRRIFSQYIPTLERGRIRPHHREFISRNEPSSPERRALLLASLARYDLADLRGVNPQFNRERDPFTDRKLREIEDAADRR